MIRRQLFRRSIMGYAQILLIYILFSLIIPQVAQQSTQLDYDKSITPSSFGEPVFRLQPPNVIHYLNTQGATLICLASGSPKPTITWYSSQSGLDASQLSSLSGDGLSNDLNSRPVTNITNLRLILQDGAALRLLPFKESQFRQDVHSAEYRCVASNRIATIHSKSVSTHAVIKREPPPTDEPETAVRVSDEFVQLKAVAVLKCRLRSSPLDVVANADRGDLFRAVAESASNPKTDDEPPDKQTDAHRPLAFEWLTSDGLQVSPTEPLARANKLVAFESGELHLNNVEMSDLRRTYGCRLRNATSRRVVASSNMARLILMDGQQQQQQPPVQVLHTLDQVLVLDSSQPEQSGPPPLVDYGQAKERYGGAHWSHRGPSLRTQTPSASSRHHPSVVLPCAVRTSTGADLKPHRGRWLYQPTTLQTHSAGDNRRADGTDEEGASSSSPRPITLDQLVGFNRQWLQLQTNAPEAQHLNHSSLSSVLASRIVVGPSFLLIERPRMALSGRYLYQILSEDGADDGLSRPERTVCDINVIVRQPIRLQMRLVGDPLGSDKQAGVVAVDSPQFGPMTSALAIEPAATSVDQIGWSLKSWLGGWLEPSPEMKPAEVRRLKRAAASLQQADNERDVQAAERSASSGGDSVGRLRVFGPGRVPETPVVRLGDRLELNCVARGHPIESIRWFRQGQAINVQTSSDFQTELTNLAAADSSAANGTSGAPNLVSRLLIRQLQPRDFGLQVFECFARNSLGDRARAAMAIYVADREQLELTRLHCPLVVPWQESTPEKADVDTPLVWPAEEFEASESDTHVETSAADEQRSLLKRRDPFGRVRVLEGEPVELQCPVASSDGEHHQIDWYKWTPNKNVKDHEQRTGVADLVSWLDRWRRMGDATSSASASSSTPAEQESRRRSAAGNTGASSSGDRPASPVQRLIESQFSQLFGGDSRFVINGSSLQIRSPSKRHDETLFVCLRRARHKPSPAGLQQQQQQPHSVHQSSMLPPASQSGEAPSAIGQYGRPAGRGCLEALFAGSDAELQNEPTLQQQLPIERRPDIGHPLVSSISIRIVAKPKIDPFEFSRNLEEGMRTVVVCTIVSGQSLVDINWFKDGEPLVEDGKDSSGMSIDHSSGFSSSLTFHRIRPGHSGQYTCIASNALATAEHTSRLLVNVAPYFVEPPKSQRVYLNSNVLINCRADGQPSPQIRWRKLVPIGTASESRGAPRSSVELVAPLSGSSGSPASGSNLFSEFEGNMAQQMALIASGSGGLQFMSQQQSPMGSQQQQAVATQAVKQEFRIITSNSHIQILENGSMIIRGVELGDAARYSCQASNGVQPILSEAIDLQVLSPAQFGVTFETVSVKRDSLVKLNCVPQGDQPIKLDWFKEGLKLARQSALGSAESIKASLNEARPSLSSKYNELLHVLAEGALATSGGHHHQRRLDGQPMSSSVEIANGIASNRNLTISRHHQLVLQDQRPSSSRNGSSSHPAGPSHANQTALSRRISSDSVLVESSNERDEDRSHETGPFMVGSELIISSADRSDSGLFVCVASNPYGRDELTYRLIVQEPPDAPFNLQVQSVLSTSLTLLWQTPFDGNTPINYYVVEYRKLQNHAQTSPPSLSSQSASGGPDWTRIIVNTDQQAEPLTAASVEPQVQTSMTPMAPSTASRTNMITLKQLAPKSPHQIRVAAVNSMGQGLFSPIQLVSTAEEAPQTRPVELRAQPVGSSAIKLSWRGPVPRPQDEAPIRGYYVSHKRHQADNQPKLAGVDLGGTQSGAGSSGWIATVSLSSSNYSVQSGDTLPLVSSEDLRPISEVRQQQQPQKLVSYEFLLQTLDRSTKYDIRVQPFNSMGLGPVGELSAQTLNFDRPAQPILKLVEARKQSLELKWSVPGFPPTHSPISSQVPSSTNSRDSDTSSKAGQELLGFSLYYKCEFDDWQEIQLALIFHYVIENLRCGNKYQIYLSAYNSVGRSDPSDVMSVRTEGTVPLAPEKGAFFRLNISEVVLDMSAWSSGGCPISSFMIQFKRLHDKNWFILSEGATPFQRTDKIIIPDLTPATWYKLLVTALNEAGSTNAEYIFGTLTPDGQQLTPPSYLVDQIQQQQGQPIRTITSMLNSLMHLVSGGGGGNGNGGANNGNGTQDGQLLFPLSCILLLLVTSLASYLYYNTSASKSARGKQARNGLQAPKCQHHNLSSRRASSEHTMQLLDRSLFRAGSHSCLAGKADSSASSSSSGGLTATGHLANQQHQAGPMLSQTLTFRPHHQHQPTARQQLFQSMLLSDSASKSQLLPDDESKSQANYLQMPQTAPDGSSPGMCEQTTSSEQEAARQTMGELDQTQALTNYVLDSFLSQQQASANLATGALGGHCGGHTMARQHGQPMAGTCRPATMKLFTQNGPQSAALGDSYFDGAASSSMSSSGLGGSATTHTSGGNPTVQPEAFNNTLHLIDGLQQQQQPPAPNGYDFDCDQILDKVQQMKLAGHKSAEAGRHATSTYVDLIQTQQQQQQADDAGDMQQYRFDALLSQQIYREPCQRLMGSSSFASATDLLQRQQQQQQQPEVIRNEPIYQRLDRFKACGLPTCATLNPQLAYKMKQHLVATGQSFSLEERGVAHPNNLFSQSSQGPPPPPPPMAPFEFRQATGEQLQSEPQCDIINNHYQPNCR